MNKLLALAAAALLTGCGISSIHCEIITDRELITEILTEVLKQNEITTPIL